jgi:uncharacterized RDD family membrane protein YckC
MMPTNVEARPTGRAIRITLGDAVPLRDLQALHRGGLAALPAVSQLAQSAGVDAFDPVYDLSVAEVAIVSPLLARSFEARMAPGADEATARRVLAASPLVGSVEGAETAVPAPAREVAEGLPETRTPAPAEAVVVLPVEAAPPAPPVLAAAPAPLEGVVAAPEAVALQPEAAPEPPAPAPAMEPEEAPVEVELEYAGFWLRAVAVFVDTILVMAIVGMLAFGLFAVAFSAPGVGGLSFWAIPVAVWLYWALSESSSLQATPGKIAVGIRVVDMDGRRLTFGRASGRFLARLLSHVIPFGVGFIMAGFTPRKQALHDLIAGTLVVKGH